MSTAPPEMIELPGARVRRDTIEDAEAIARAIADDLPRLAVYMDWATPDVATAQAQRERILDCRAQWEEGTAFDYLIEGGDGAVLGKIGFPRRIDDACLELGYWLTGEAEGRGLITGAAYVLTAHALQLDGIERVEIHCDAANLRSRAVPQRLGYRLDRVVDCPVVTSGQTGRQEIWISPTSSPVGVERAASHRS